jgi:hypothetical protein
LTNFTLALLTGVTNTLFILNFTAVKFIDLVINFDLPKIWLWTPFIYFAMTNYKWLLALVPRNLLSRMNLLYQTLIAANSTDYFYKVLTGPLDSYKFSHNESPGEPISSSFDLCTYLSNMEP